MQATRSPVSGKCGKQRCASGLGSAVGFQSQQSHPPACAMAHSSSLRSRRKRNASPESIGYIHRTYGIHFNLGWLARMQLQPTGLRLSMCPRKDDTDMACLRTKRVQTSLNDLEKGMLEISFEESSVHAGSRDGTPALRPTFRWQMRSTSRTMSLRT